VSTIAPILLNSVLRLINSARMNWPNPPVGPRMSTESSDIDAIVSVLRETFGGVALIPKVLGGGSYKHEMVK